MILDFTIRKKKLSLILLAIICAVAVTRVALTYHEVSVTYDETDHIACGMQWVDRGVYLYEPMHPVIARGATALLPYLDGARAHGDTNLWTEGNDILHSQQGYWRTLILARLGILPFFILGIVMIFMWGRELYDDATGLVACGIFSMLPLVLAHAGLATTDIPATAMFSALCFVYYKWLLSPSTRKTIVFAIVAAFATATKFSVLFFFVPLAIVLMLYKLWMERPRGSSTKRRWVVQNISQYVNIRSIALIATISFFIVWALYHFSFGSVVLPYQIASFDRHLHTAWPSGGWKNSTLYWLGHTAIPAPSFFNGLGEMFILNQQGVASYFMGHAMHGAASLFFYPVAFIVKDPIGFLLLFILGCVALAMVFRKTEDWRALPLIVTVILFGICLGSHFNIGARHLLPLFPFLCLIAAFGAIWLWRLPHVAGKIIVTVFGAWIVVASASAHPAYLSYFNSIVGNHPEHYLLDSDLDWGQDVDKMADTLRAHNVQKVAVAYFGTADLARQNFPAFDTLHPNERPVSPWIAISKFYLYSDSGYAWLRTQTPVSHAGASMLLYRQ